MRFFEIKGPKMQRALKKGDITCLTSDLLSLHPFADRLFPISDFLCLGDGVIYKMKGGQRSNEYLHTPEGALIQLIASKAVQLFSQTSTGFGLGEVDEKVVFLWTDLLSQLWLGSLQRNDSLITVSQIDSAFHEARPFNSLLEIRLKEYLDPVKNADMLSSWQSQRTLSVCDWRTSQICRSLHRSFIRSDGLPSLTEDRDTFVSNTLSWSCEDFMTAAWMQTGDNNNTLSPRNFPETIEDRIVQITLLKFLDSNETISKQRLLHLILSDCRFWATIKNSWPKQRLQKLLIALKDFDSQNTCWNGQCSLDVCTGCNRIAGYLIIAREIDYVSLEITQIKSVAEKRLKAQISAATCGVENCLSEFTKYVVKICHLGLCTCNSSDLGCNEEFSLDHFQAARSGTIDKITFGLLCALPKLRYLLKQGNVEVCADFFTLCAELEKHWREKSFKLPEATNYPKLFTDETLFEAMLQAKIEDCLETLRLFWQEEAFRSIRLSWFEDPGTRQWEMRRGFLRRGSSDVTNWSKWANVLLRSHLSTISFRQPAEDALTFLYFRLLNLLGFGSSFQCSEALGRSLTDHFLQSPTVSFYSPSTSLTEEIWICELIEYAQGNSQAIDLTFRQLSRWIRKAVFHYRNCDVLSRLEGLWPPKMRLSGSTHLNISFKLGILIHTLILGRMVTEREKLGGSFN